MLETKESLTMITRPRKFGKSLNLSMLEYFLTPIDSENNKKLFADLNIIKNKSLK